MYPPGNTLLRLTASGLWAHLFLFPLDTQAMPGVSTILSRVSGAGWCRDPARRRVHPAAGRIGSLRPLPPKGNLLSLHLFTRAALLSLPGFCAGAQKPKLKGIREPLWDWLGVNNDHPRRRYPRGLRAMEHDQNRRGHLPSRVPLMRLLGSPVQKILLPHQFCFCAASAKTG